MYLGRAEVLGPTRHEPFGPIGDITLWCASIAASQRHHGFLLVA